MTDQGYEQKKHECWEQFWHEANGSINRCPETYEDLEAAFYTAFDRAYALGKQEITQEDVEKASLKYILNRQQARHDAKREEEASLSDFDNTLKAWDAFDMAQAYEDGANFALGKEFGNSELSVAEGTVISGWVARIEDGHLFMYSTKPERDEALQVWIGRYADFDLRNYLFPDLTWDSDPEEVELIIKRKKK